MTEHSAALARWHACVAGQDMSKLREILAEDAVFRSPFLWKPKQGARMVEIVLSAAVRVFEDFTYHREMTDGTSWTLEFSARVGEFSVKGVDLIRFDENGRIAEFEVMIRPVKGLHALAEAMAREMTAQGTFEAFSNG